MAAATIAVSALMGKYPSLCGDRPKLSSSHTNKHADLCSRDDRYHHVAYNHAVNSRRSDFGAMDLQERRLPISRFLSSDVGCHLASTDGCLSCEQILVCHKTYLVPTCLYRKEIDQLCSGCQFVRVSV